MLKLSALEFIDFFIPYFTTIYFYGFDDSTSTISLTDSKFGPILVYLEGVRIMFLYIDGCGDESYVIDCFSSFYKLILPYSKDGDFLK